MHVDVPNCIIIISAAENTTEKNKDEITKLGILRARLKADIPVKELESLTGASFISKQVETILDQIKHLRAAVSTTIDKAKNKSSRKTAESKTALVSICALQPEYVIIDLSRLFQIYRLRVFKYE